jgi:hypothetical protein
MRSPGSTTSRRSRRRRIVTAGAALAAVGAIVVSGSAMGGNGTVRDEIYVDTTPPDTSIEGPALTRDSSPTFRLGATEEPVRFSCKLDKGSFERCGSPYTRRVRDGAHRLEVRATDKAGNTDPTPAVHVFEVDSTPPRLEVHGPRGLINNPEPEFEVEVNEGVEFECSLNGEALDHCSPTVGVGTLADGPYRLVVSAIDPAGNSSRVVREFRVDTQVDTAITRGPGGPVGKRRVGFKFEAEGGERARFFCSLDGAAFKACKSPKRLRGLALGPHTFAVYAVDRAGNVDETPAERAFEITGRG